MISLILRDPKYEDISIEINCVTSYYNAEPYILTHETEICLCGADFDFLN